MKKDSFFIDAGAFVGDSAVVLSKYTNQKVYSFEPSPKTYNLLLKTISMNNMEEKIMPVMKGLSDKSEILKANERIDGGFSFTRFNLSEEITQSSLITLDDFVKDNNIKVGLIKADVEGFEQKLLEGAKETIKNQKPILLISIYHNPSDFFEIKPMIESWNLGYEFKIRKFHPSHIVAETMLICSAKN